MSPLPSAFACLNELLIPHLNHIFDGNSSKKLRFHLFSSSGFYFDFIICTYFTRIAVLSTLNDDVANYRPHIEH